MGIGGCLLFLRGTGNWLGISVAISILIIFLHWCKYAAVEDIFWSFFIHINAIVEHMLPLI